MERWNAYLKNGEQTELILERGQAIPKGLFHLVVDVLVQHQDGDILFVQRSYDKSGYPGYFEASAGGSVLLDEGSQDAALRELEEETGILLQNQVHFLERQFFDDDACIIDSYLVQTNCEKSAIRLQETETIGFEWVAPEKLEEFLQNHLVVPRQKNFVKKLFLND